jgi:hypothetical protein
MAESAIRSFPNNVHLSAHPEAVSTSLGGDAPQ